MHTFLPLEFDYEKAAQLDWGEATGYMNVIKAKVQIFCMRLCTSCATVRNSVSHSTGRSISRRAPQLKKAGSDI
ncbi:MAG: hypothetical protein ACOY30_05180 [Bacillota bacterium]